MGLRSTVFLIGLGLVPCAAASAHDNGRHDLCEQVSEDPSGLLAEFPKTERFKLSTGQVVLMPEWLNDYESTMLAGSAPIEKVRKVLAPEDLEPIAVADHPELAQVNLVVLYYRKSDFGSYNETLVMIPAREREIECGGPTRAGVFVHHIGVSDEDAILPGAEIWGYSKVSERSSVVSQNDVTIKVDGRVKLVCSGCATLAVQARPRGEFMVVSSYEKGRHWFRVVTAGDAAIRPFDRARDVFELNQGSPMSNKLLRLGFTPSTWIYAPNSVGVSYHHL